MMLFCEPSRKLFLCGGQRETLPCGRITIGNTLAMKHASQGYKKTSPEIQTSMALLKSTKEKELQRDLRCFEAHML